MMMKNRLLINKYVLCASLLACLAFTPATAEIISASSVMSRILPTNLPKPVADSVSSLVASSVSAIVATPTPVPTATPSPTPTRAVSPVARVLTVIPSAKPTQNPTLKPVDAPLKLDIPFSALLGKPAAPRASVAASSVAGKIQSPTPNTEAKKLQPEEPDAHYGRLLRRELFKQYSDETVQQIQTDLAKIYHDHPDWIRDVNLGKKPLTDGKMGPVTLFWMQRYCINFKVKQVGDFVAELPEQVRRIALFSAEHPAEKNILLSADFDLWNTHQPEPLRSQNYTVRRSGSDAQLMALVQQYNDSKEKKTTQTVFDKSDALTSYSYVLTADDFVKLQNKESLMMALAKLKDQPFSDIDALKKAVSAALQAFPGAYMKAWPVVETNVNRIVHYQINDASLLAMSQVGISPSIIHALETIKDTPPKDKAAFLPIIEPVLQKALALPIKPSAPARNISIEEQLLGDKMDAEMDSSTMRLILRESEQSNELSLNQASIEKIAAGLPRELTMLSIPAQVVNVLKEIQDISYPEGLLFHKAAQTRISIGMAACTGNTADYNKYIAGLRFSTSDFNNLKKELMAAAAGDAILIERSTESLRVIESLRAARQVCSVQERERVNAAISQLYTDLMRPAIMALYQKKLPYNPTANIQWRGGFCGCVLDKLAGTTYGFYPFWKTDGKPQQINFSVLSRIGVTGLTFDELGELKQLNNGTASGGLVDNNSPEANEFVRTARSYNTKVDWVIEKSDWYGVWASYTTSHKAALLDKLAGNITRFLSTPLTDVTSKFKPYVSFGSSKVPTRGDGVTLYFKDYPSDPDSVVLFNQFVLKLKEKLAAKSPKFFVNILVSQTAIGGKEGVFTYKNLLSLTDDEKNHSASMDEKAIRENLNSHVLVLLAEPSTDGKKRLRQEVENALHGSERKSLLRNILPVLVFDNKNWAQFQDDLIYLNDNFGGASFWPITTTADPVPSETTLNCVDSKNFVRCIQLNFLEQGANGQPDSFLKKLVCQYRWTFRILFDLSLMILIVVTVIYFRSCAIRSRVSDRLPLYVAGFVLPPMVLLTLQLLFDPSWASISRGNLPFIISLVILVCGAFATYLYVRGKQNVPSRAALKSLMKGQPIDRDGIEKPKKSRAPVAPKGTNVPSRASLTALVRSTQSIVRSTQSIVRSTQSIVKKYTKK